MMPWHCAKKVKSCRKIQTYKNSASLKLKRLNKGRGYQKYQIFLYNNQLSTNAAKVINKIGVGQIHDSKWTGKKCKTTPVAVFDEPSTRKVEWEQLSLSV